MSTPRKLMATRVILVHGLGRSARMFAFMRRRMRQEGFEPIAYDYRSTASPAEVLVQEFCDYLDALEQPERETHLVGFSLGGILIRGALLAGHPVNHSRAVMIGPPNRGASVLNRKEARFTRKIFGPAVEDLKEGSPFISKLGEPEAEIGVIAGTRRFFPFNPSSWIHLFQGEEAPHDGTIKVQNTKLERMTDFVTVPANHTYMCAHPETIQQTIAFLKFGRFEGGQLAASGPTMTDPSSTGAGTNR